MNLLVASLLFMKGCNEIEDEELHGVPLDGAALLKCAMLKGMSDTDSRTPVLYSYEENIEGMPLDTTKHIGGVQSSEEKLKTGGSLISSKWESKRSRPGSGTRWIRLHLLRRMYHCAVMTISTTVEASLPEKEHRQQQQLQLQQL
ncbi:hypothetical protein quinque_014611 [Culex quinquefasciatus]